MSWRVVVVTGCAKVDYKMDYVVVRSIDHVRRVHISEIAVLMLENTAISVTAYALSELVAHKVKVIFCDRARNPQSELIPCSGTHDSTEKIRQQIAWKKGTKEAVWTRIVRAKIEGQRAVLRYWGRQDAQRLTAYLEGLQPGDPSNREAHAAKVYFSALFGSGFHRDAACAENAALNYGYGLILSAVNREISTAGYLTQLGICHDNTYNPFNLGSDLMEPFRPMADQAVMKMELKSFEKEHTRRLVALLNQEVRIDGQKQTFLYALRVYSASVFRALNEDDPEAIRMIDYEL